MIKDTNDIKCLTIMNHFIHEATQLTSFIDSQIWNNSINHRTIHYQYQQKK